jgi:OFA family oxalate/formate antiporter-like MFS transporter
MHGPRRTRKRGGPFVILLCYGGGFGTMPAFAADYFGPRNVGSIYGLMLTAWGFGSAFGPILIARIRETTGHYGGALHIIAAIMLISSIGPFIVHPPSKRREPRLVPPHAKPTRP